MGSHRKKKSISGSNSSSKPPHLEEVAVSSTSSASTDAVNSYTMPRTQHHRRASNNLNIMQPVESGGSDCSTVVDATKSATVGSGNNNTLNPTSDWSNDIAKALQEIEGANKTFRFSWKEMFAMCLVLFAFACISIFAGIAAGISISVHYYETPENVDLRMLNYPALDSVSPHRVTILDPAIASSNRLHPFKSEDELRRVIHTSTNGQKTLLPIVEESPIMNAADSSSAPPSSSSAHADRASVPVFDETASSFPQRPRYPVMILDEWLREQPKLCSDRKTMGYDSWTSLRSAVRDINRYSAHRFDRWHDYFTAVEEMMASPELYPNGAMLNPASFADDRMYYEERIVLTICPGAVLKPSRRHAIFINTESVMIECEGCQVVGGSTHLSFGPAAQNTVIRGILFKMAGSSSLLFYHDGAEVAFEDCTWIVRENRKTSSLGAIAEVNSTSLISFSRCVASESDGRLTEMTTSLRNA
jgi:hypothetical protein